MLTAPLLLTLALTPADASAPPDGPPPPAAVRVSDAGELQGTWEVVGCVNGAISLTAKYRGGKWVFTGPTAVRFDGNGGRVVGVSVRVDPTSEPLQIDAASEDGFLSVGVYRRAGDELLWAVDVSGDGRRPSSTEPASGVWVWTLRRVKK
jgi:uncharacterized protein (TIGR03067 family)